MRTFLMRTFLMLLVTISLMATSAEAQRRGMRGREADFMSTPPLVGDAMPVVEVFDIDGNTVSTDSLLGHYTVLTFGCLTCPPSIWNIRGLEAVERDYGPKGVKFYFIFMSLAHPELVGNYVQAFTNEERIAQARQAVKQFGTTIPWLVDNIDNRLRHALGDRPNSQFLIDPSGKIVRKRAWSNPQFVRRDLEHFVGPSDQITPEESIRLTLAPALPMRAPRGFVDRIERLNKSAIVAVPDLKSADQPFFAKLRAEADAELLAEGRGELYLGFHLDPFHGAYWNNLAKPLSVKLSAAEDVRLDRLEWIAEKVEAITDSDPREFVVNVAAWPEDQPIRVDVLYYACQGGETCHAVRQSYQLRRQRDGNGGGARSEGAGYWSVSEFTSRILAGDENGDGRITRAEAVGLLLPHFEKLDRDGDQHLDRSELAVVTQWLNHHHQPGVPNTSSRK
ncbi:MAG: TlpA disulfide reductase family protein [Pirellulaceae bacterium]